MLFRLSDQSRVRAGGGGRDYFLSCSETTVLRAFALKITYFSSYVYFTAFLSMFMQLIETLKK